MTEYLIVVAVGPVQEFIAAARKSRDLWFGSWLLSELSKAVARHLQEQGATLIFPNPEDSSKDLEFESSLNVTNRILAITSNIPDAKSLRSAIESDLLRLYEKAKNIFWTLTSEIDAEAQIRDIPELYWVALPLPSRDDMVYQQVRNQVENLLSARKATRNFSQPTWANGVPKSSFDGQRESVIPEQYYPVRGTHDPNYADKKDNLYKVYHAGPAERLSAVDLLKRWGEREKQKGFPSTSHIAVQSYITGLSRIEQNDTIKEAWKTYVGSLALMLPKGIELARAPTASNTPSILGDYDGELLFESRLREYFIQSSDFEKAKKLLRTFYDAVKGIDKELGSPIPYYAILQADGDDMGEVIDNQQSIVAHQALSRSLSCFARKDVVAVVKDYGGALIFAGGEDILALLPLHTVLDCAKKLADTFHEKMNNAGIQDANNVVPTLSVGVAVVHHLEPLSDCLALVRETEKRAKSVKGKNALAVTVSKRSGSTRTVKGQWDDLYPRLQNFIMWHGADEIPDGLAYEYQSLIERLRVLANDPHSAVLEEVIRTEAVRLLKRKRAKRGREEVNENKDLVETMNLYINGREATGENSEIPPIPLEQIAEEMIVARLFADTQNQAYGAPLSNISQQEQTQ